MRLFTVVRIRGLSRRSRPEVIGGPHSGRRLETVHALAVLGRFVAIASAGLVVLIACGGLGEVPHRATACELQAELKREADAVLVRIRGLDDKCVWARNDARPEQGLGLKCPGNVSRDRSELLYERGQVMKRHGGLECDCLEELGDIREAAHCRAHRGY